MLFFRVNTETRDFEEVKEGDITLADFQSDVSNNTYSSLHLSH